MIASVIRQKEELEISLKTFEDETMPIVKRMYPKNSKHDLGKIDEMITHGKTIKMKINACEHYILANS